MTKTISLSDEAYELLASVKRPGESFSEVAQRLAKLAAQAEIFRRTDEPPVWSDRQAERMKRDMYRARDETRQPRVRRP